MKYNGIIKISIKDKNNDKNDIIIHNTGTLELQQILCNSFIGDYDDNNVPTYLGLYTTSDTGEPVRPTDTISENIILTAKHIETFLDAGKTNYKAVFTASIISNDKNNKTIKKIGLISKNNKLLAYKFLGDKEKELNDYLSANREVVIDWSMTISVSDT